MVALMTVTSRSWMRSLTWARAWGRPMPVWRSLLSTRRVTTPKSSTWSVRTRPCVVLFFVRLGPALMPVV
ncbi:hypothetical protein C5E07_17375 [Pseudoclavibacter sp. RFBJ3]|nr:hypothetical protein C5C12_02820 [Pseudoclavibacter sp. RFBJ5]PPF89771.1 hypothetical protein C5E07_17375 [Pseudoclavibacter sp. RFBJ3]PPF97341.1 hypothetical protein C5C19_12245 [Pseudoclavibacter sp. RFBH5]PPG19657.1 hypothetical protein C5E13_16260 [Pseudoclavibacter sp. RFBI4]